MVDQRTYRAGRTESPSAGPAGSSTDTTVPPSGRSATAKRPPSASTRSARPRSPLPRGSAPPRPSSAISSRSAPGRRSTWTSMPDAPACLTAFVMLSATTKYAPASTASSRRSSNAPWTVTGSAAESASDCSAAARPRSVSTAGCRPRASSRSSRMVELAPRRAHEVARGARVAVEQAHDEPQLERERDEPLLCPVVEVALEAAALLEPGLQDPQAGGVELLARLGALEAERDELGEVAEAPLGVGAQRVGVPRGDEDQAPGLPADDDRRRDRGAEAVAPHHLRGAAAHVGVVVDAGGAAGARDDRRQAVAAVERDRRADIEPARPVALLPAPDRDREAVVVADRRRRARAEEPPGLLGHGAEDRGRLGARRDERRDAAQRGLLLDGRRVRAGARDDPRLLHGPPR